MDKYEFQIKTEQLEKLLESKDYETAAKIADSIDWRKVHNVGLLMKVSDIYENLERYEDSYEILNIAYDSAPIGRMIVYKMTEMAVKMGEFDEAVELYKEFIKIAPHDLGRYALKYEIYKGRGSSVEDQIAILEEYKSREYQEKWAYELATLYYKEGMLSKCVEECDDLILWFSEGEYVAKAMELKMRIQPLTASQEEKYRQMADETKAEQIEVKPVNMDEFNTINLQEALAEELQDFMEEETQREAQQETQQMEEETYSAKEEPEQTAAPLSRDTFSMPHFLGQDASGQLTFDMQENVLDRQITGQMTIEDILNGWEEKKRETEAAIAEAAKRDEERRKEREYLRATGQLPDLSTEVVTTLPDEIQRLIDEIEGKLPVKVHVEPIMRDGRKEEQQEELPPEELQAEEQPVQTVEPQPEEEEAPAEPEISLDEVSLDLVPEEIQEILEGDLADWVEQPQEIEETDDTPEAEKPQSEEGEAETEGAEAEEAGEEESEAEESQKADVSSTSPMIDSLEKVLEAELSTIPPGQLSEEQKKLFAYFTSVRGMSRQLAELLEEDRMRREQREDSIQGNIVITGESGTGKTTLAEDIVKALQRQRRVKGSRMAKVEASSLNGKNVSTVVEKLGGGALLIEKAGNLKTETAVQLSHAMTRKTGGLLVILEDDQDEIRKLFIRCESLGAKFTRTIEIPTFTNKELVAFGESYALEQECVLDEMAVLALYNRIGNNQTSDHLVNVAEVKDMVDEAIRRGGKKGLFGKVKKSRMDEFGHIILLEKDFEV